ncbi:MAG TPA: nucleotide exchange factor GrpE [Gammaproteobacteria bacterium]|nr:nucleotide exchange factor GrpE [Gammaproteobacteria bacterium]
MSSHHHKDKAGSTAALHNKLHKGQPDAASDAAVEEPEVELLSYEELQKRLAEAEEKASQSWERLLRLQADMDNMQRRVERDVSNAHKYALEKFVLELLPIVDGLERAVLAHEDEDSGSGSLLDGVQLTLKMIYAAFTKFGIEQVDPTGESFNPEWHQAVSTETNADVKPNTVLTVLQKGYLLNGRLMRPALVIVAK